MDDDVRHRLGERMRKARDAAGLSQRELAAKMGCNATTITHRETGRVSMSAEDLAAFGAIVGVEPGRLMKGINRRTRKAAARKAS